MRNAHTCTDLAWSQSYRGLSHLDEKSATHSDETGGVAAGALGVIRSDESIRNIGRLHRSNFQKSISGNFRLAENSYLSAEPRG